MKKQLLSLAAAIALMPSFNANAEATLTEVWKTGNLPELNANWDSSAPDWTSTDAIKKESCSRFATGRDGVLYTINMKTMSIAKITKDGVEDVYKLPKLEGDDYYGTAISIDEVGNFLVGHYFTKAPMSSQVWTIYCPSDGSSKQFNIGYPGGMKPEDYNDGGLTTNTGISRIDCVGRVIGDLTGESAFFVAPHGNAAAGAPAAAFNIRIINGYNEDGTTVETVQLEANEYVPTYLGTSGGQNIVQPSIANIEEFGTPDDELAHKQAYILCSGEGGEYDVFSCYKGAPQSSACDKMQAAWRAMPFHSKNNGFDTFVADGHRYFLHSFVSSEAEQSNNNRPMSVGVFNELGEMVASWVNLDYLSSNNGYNSIIAQPQADGSVLIHTYSSCTAYGAAAVLKFTPESSDEMLGSEKNPIHVSTAEDLLTLATKCLDGTSYVVLDNDIDLTGVQYKVPFSEQAAATKTIHFNGNNHVIKNLKGAVNVTGEGEDAVTTVVTQNASVFGSIKGSIRNLGVENIDVNVTWFCTGGITGTSVGDLTIDNCYATGSVQGAASGGLVGSCNAGNLTITNCYSQVNTADNAGGHSAGLVGRANSNLSISNAYASGSVYSKENAAGLVNINTATNVTLTNVVAWNSSVRCEGDGAVAGPTVNGDGATLNNVEFYKEMLINEVPIYSGADAETLQATVTAWDAYSKTLVNGYPVLAWQEGQTGGVNDIVADESDAPAEYYNLQGIKVANPENGIYIVRRGNKVTKEIIR